MKGTVGTELELTFSFHEDGALQGLASASIEKVELPEHISSVLWRFLRDLKAADKLLEAAAYNREDEADDSAADDCRMPGAAE